MGAQDQRRGSNVHRTCRTRRVDINCRQSVLREVFVVSPLSQTTGKGTLRKEEDKASIQKGVFLGE